MQHTGTTDNGHNKQPPQGAHPCGTMLQITAQKNLGRVNIDVAFHASGRATALFGPSGSGKTSTLNMIAGLLKPDKGRITIGETVLFDSDKHIDLPVHKRRIGYVFQEHRLFPHLNVMKNLVYGRSMNRLPRNSTHEDRIVSLLDITSILERRIGALSGGEKQRVAIGRALLSKPLLLLFDEPMASLDEARKAELFPYLERLRDEAAIPMVYVSHDENEVKRLADSIVYFADGKAKTRQTTNEKVQ
ncbi:MAG: molybdenum ABC transporter ATP-binding protein [Afipia sp.]|nr:molybdenum ABC transporter ATP-binding protein [Afipia sp.]